MGLNFEWICKVRTYICYVEVVETSKNEQKTKQKNNKKQH